ncbi:MAG: 50S ribosomal protein L37ae [Thermoplasmatota archaeon]
MSKRTKKAKSVGRFGPRYGVSVRRRIREVEARQHAVHECTKCGAPKVQRTSTGVWACKKCGAKFAGGAYIPQTLPFKSSERAIREVLEKGSASLETMLPPEEVPPPPPSE